MLVALIVLWLLVAAGMAVLVGRLFSRADEDAGSVTDGQAAPPPLS